MVFGLVVAHSHFTFKVLLGLYEIKLADELDEVITTKSLSVFLRELIFIYLEDLDSVSAHSRSAILDKDVKLDKLKSIVSTFACEYNLMVGIHAR